MQIVSLGDNLHDMPKSIFLGKKKNTISLSSAELAQRVIKVDCFDTYFIQTTSSGGSFHELLIHERVCSERIEQIPPSGKRKEKAIHVIRDKSFPTRLQSLLAKTQISLRMCVV